MQNARGSCLSSISWSKPKFCLEPGDEPLEAPRYPTPSPKRRKTQLNWKNLCFEPKATSGCSWHSTLHWQCFIILTQWGLFPLTLRRYVTQPSVPFPARLQQVVLIIDFPTPYCFQQALRGDCYERRGIYLPLKANLLVQ